MFSDSTSRSSRQEVFCKKGLKNFAILIGKHLCWSVFLTLLKETPARVISCKYCEISKDSFFIKQPLWLLLVTSSKLFLLNPKKKQSSR